MEPTLRLEESEGNSVGRASVPVMKYMTLAESKRVSRCKFEQVGSRFLVVPLVEWTRQRCVKQILVAKAGAYATEKRNKPFIGRQRDSRVDPTRLFHFLESSA